MYREEAKTKCPACQRTGLAAVREFNGKMWGEGLLVSRHLYQEGTETNGIGLPVLTARGFCPGSLHPVKP
jgi:hypothetical protein